MVRALTAMAVAPSNVLFPPMKLYKAPENVEAIKTWDLVEKVEPTPDSPWVCHFILQPTNSKLTNSFFSPPDMVSAKMNSKRFCVKRLRNMGFRLNSGQSW